MPENFDSVAHLLKQSRTWKIEIKARQRASVNCGAEEDSLRVPQTTRTSNQSILKEISPEHSLEGLMLKLKLQYFGHRCEDLTHWRRPWCWERLKAGREGDDRGWDDWMSSLDSMDISLSSLQKMVKDRKVWWVEVQRVAKSWTRLSNWTELNWMSFYIHFQL